MEQFIFSLYSRPELSNLSSPIMKKIYLFLVISGALTFSFDRSIAQQLKQDLTLKEIWASRKFIPDRVQGINSMEDGLHYTSLDDTKDGAEVNQYSYQTGKLVKNIVKPADLILTDTVSIEDYQFNADETKLLIATETEPIYRHSSKSTFYIYDIKTKQLTLLSEGGKQRYATFSPVYNQVAFVRDNNIFIKDIDKGKETQVTFNGKQNAIINGATDWVYEEEFSFDKAFSWSPDGDKIAYYQFDESKVREFSLATYGKNLYPEEYKYKYPKAGEDNSTVQLFFYDVKTNATQKIQVGNEPDQYIPRIKWTNDPNMLSFIRMNRHQNKLELLFADASTGKSNVILTEVSTTYIDITDDLTFLKDKKHFIWSSEKDNFNHLYLYDINGKLIRQITNGNWDIISFKGIDEKDGVLYYISAELSPMQRDLYCIKTDGSKKTRLSTLAGNNKAEFSKGFKFYINDNSNANTPPYISLHNANGKEIRVLKDNNTLKKTLESYNLSKKEFFKFKTSENVELNAWMIKPANLDSNKIYPVFMTVYGGPGAQTVNDSWEGNNYLWHQLIAQKGYIVVSVDNRGTGARGSEFKKCTYLQLGKLETIDQVEAAKYIGSLKYVDKNRIAIQGWSYGGYLSSLCLTKGADYFKTAIAVAPVTNWRFYDTIYTERYMQTPQENPSGYDENSPINHIDKLKGKYLLIHGTADDNVHFQNTVEMTTALVNANKEFDLFMYPDKNHGIYGGLTRLHLYNKMTNFILNNL